MNGTGITDYRAEYKKGTLVKEWLYSDKKKKNGITNRYKIKGETLIKKVNDIRTVPAPPTPILIIAGDWSRQWKPW